MTIYKIVLVSIFLILGSGLAVAAPSLNSLDELIAQVRKNSVLESRELAEREKLFRQQRDKQASMLSTLKAKLAAERNRGFELKKLFEENENFITVESERLNEQMGSLGELFGVVRQNAKDMMTMFNGSIISAQLQGRNESIKRLATNKSNPTIKEMEEFWRLVLDEMVQSGKVVRFETPVITHNGEEVRKEVVRLGAFNILSDGLYLRYLPETGRLVELGRQPASRFVSLARTLQQTESGVAAVALDPSRGAILSLMVQTPSIIERVNQGGVIGYLIIIIGLIGLALVVERMVALTLSHRKMQQQQTGGVVTTSTPLSRIRQVAEDNPRVDSETLGLKLDQAILKERPMIRRFLPTIAIFAAISPLLGLLGTVSGMIETFQSITLFGTGDPKLMSGGISVALVTTELGLIVAIPLTLLHSWLSGSAKKVIFILDEESAALIASREEKSHVISS
ncbi:flagellar motor protein MotA [Methyloprofundus sedimenti]|uniref:Flagellar motor protein MotA n=1 Tax=Methyloprofundus sedimenti TaxID=1420851 RepID=A0A1V8M4F2_9GAMM|nr:MotA/TolQ/ExbB proton channel family protein [Methyloprofundus sedimenti]OQK16447.1 flagellar motor protein MotA [Methyloprofundus sedimenti]